MSLSEATLFQDVRTRLFAPSGEARTIGAELELIPVASGTGAPVLIESDRGPSLSSSLRRAAKLNGWEESSSGGVPVWTLQDGGRISFEPGGQIEISTAPSPSCSALITSLRILALQIVRAAREDGIELLSVGTDPRNDITSVPLQLKSDRYTRMTRYLEARSEFGIRMMRQTAALQISVEHGPRPFERWALLNALAPYILALFANSPRYAGDDTGHASYRAHFWRKLDPSRTGIPFDELDPAARYTSFALGAGAIAAENGAGEFREFRSLLSDPALTLEDWNFHLSTLFPEIRPKEYFEIRSADTIDPEDIAAPLVFVAGLVYDDTASCEALELLGKPDEQLLVSAGRDGLRDGLIKSRAAELVRISSKGARRLPADYLSPAHCEHAHDWLSRRVAGA